MRVLTGVAAVLFATTMFGGGGQAQPGKEPKELPPAGFTGNQYVDSDGCVFLRAGLGGQTTWVPRVGRDRQPVCGYEPTLADGASAAPAATATATQKPAATAPAAAAVEAMTKPVAAKKLRLSTTPAVPRTIALVQRKRVPADATYCAERIDGAQRYLLSDGRRVTQCAEQAAASSVEYLNGLGMPGLEVSGRAPSANEVRRAQAADRGAYKVTYARGRLNAAGQAAMAAPGAQRTATAAAPAAQYVQIGAFAEPGNADRAIAALKGMGLPVSVSRGGRLDVVLAGPFASSAELSRALSLVRAKGYRDAFPRRG